MSLTIRFDEDVLYRRSVLLALHTPSFCVNREGACHIWQSPTSASDAPIRKTGRMTTCFWSVELNIGEVGDREGSFGSCATLHIIPLSRLIRSDNALAMHAHSTFPCWSDAVLNAYRFLIRMFSKALIYLTTLTASSAIFSQNGAGANAQYLLGLGACHHLLPRRQV